MNRSVAYEETRLRPLLLGLRVAACFALLCTLAACGSRQASRSSAHYAPTRYYPPPGPPNDPWGPYVHEASGRFGIPETWIRSVMHRESGGQEDVISWAGAMGLMQVMPDTYEGLRTRYGLGGDPFDPHNNILAGTAYLREMYDRFGAPGFLAAYNAGPNRVDSYLSSGTPLPEETVSYLAALAPTLGAGTPLSGPLAVYAGSGGYVRQVASRGTMNGCDPDAAYNPDGPCTPLRQPVLQPVAAAAAVPPASSWSGLSPVGSGCDPDAAYDPDRPCQPLRVAAAAPMEAPPQAALPSAYRGASTGGGCDPDAAYDPARPCRPASESAPGLAAGPAPASAVVIAEPLPQPSVAKTLRFADNVRRIAATPAAQAMVPEGRWAIQVGAFANLTTAETAATTARMAAPDLLRMARIELPPTTPFGGRVAYRARLAGLTPVAAADACTRLSGQGLPCMTVPPSRNSF